jgi:hypothetical protein
LLFFDNIKDEIHLYALTRRSKEEWFYRLYTASTITRRINAQSIPFEHIKYDYRRICDTRRTDRLHIEILGKSRSSLHVAWPTFVKSFANRQSINDHLSFVNHVIVRCTKHFNETIHLRQYFQRKIQQELQQLKLPVYIQWIRLSNFQLDNVYPIVDKLRRIWSDQYGLWTAIDVTYQGNVSLEFTIQLNLIQNKYRHFLSSLTSSPTDVYAYVSSKFTQFFSLFNTIGLVNNISNTMLVITV